MKTWSMAINEDNGDLDTAPTSLTKTLMPAKGGTKNPYRDTGNKANKPSVTESTPTHPSNLPLSQFFQYPSPYYPYVGGPHYPQLPLPLAPHQQPLAHDAQSAERAQLPRHRSSSLPSEADLSVDKLSDYFTWLTRINPTKAEPLALCLETFKKQDIVFGTIKDISDALFTEWSISHGLRLLLQSHLKKWERAKAKGRA